MEVERLIAGKDDGVAPVVGKAAQFTVHLGEWAVSELPITSPSPRQQFFQLRSCLTVMLDGDDKEAAVSCSILGRPSPCFERRMRYSTCREWLVRC